MGLLLTVLLGVSSELESSCMGVANGGVHLIISDRKRTKQGHLPLLKFGVFRRLLLTLLILLLYWRFAAAGYGLS